VPRAVDLLLGVTSVIDAGGGFQNYPDDYAVIEQLAADGELTVRIAYNLFTQRPQHEREDFEAWSRLVRPGQGDAMYRHNGAGEMLVFSAADFEDFRQPRPDLPARMEGELEDVVRLLVKNRWPFRLHATYDETIRRALDAFERVNREMPFDGLHWFFDHAETISPESIDRVAALGGGIAVQHRMAFQGEYFLDRYGERATAAAPPVRRLLDAGVPVGAGTDATRVASHNPWVSLAWLVTGRSFSSTRLTPAALCLDRDTALDLWTHANAWFSNEEGTKGRLMPGWLADFVLLSDDYFAVPEDDIVHITSVLTVLGGRVVHGDGEFSPLAPVMPPALPDWSPVRHHAGFAARNPTAAKYRVQTGCDCAAACAVHGHAHLRALAGDVPADDPRGFWGLMGCGCWL
jgi:predicted amidohydrolase YtcJ